MSCLRDNYEGTGHRDKGKGEVMLFEISNPSDSYTIEAKDFKTACIAICVLGRGQYGLTEIGGDHSMPIFVFGGHDEWFTENFGKDFKDTLEETPFEDIAEALESVFIGHKVERELLEAKKELLAPATFLIWKAEYQENHRSSMNNIGKKAREKAQAIRAKLISSQAGRENR
jgi:hypothetical protein